ncbi:MAG: DUF134 domain-containing protein [Bacilli bacterium]
MPRPMKFRRVCSLPKNNRFGPLIMNNDQKIQDINLTIDEYEVIRLIDLEGLTQEECSKQIGTARTTVQAIYDVARRKIATSIVEGNNLIIEGGKYQLCPNYGKGCKGKRCGQKENF